MESKNGSKLTKNNSSETVINLVPPRALWNQSQKYRNLSLPNQRCGPHLSFVEPFVIEEHYSIAHTLLVQALADVKPFTLSLHKLNSFPNNNMLFVEPVVSPPDGLQCLVNALLQVFPQCNDQVKKAKDGIYKPHLSIARYQNKEELNRAKVEIMKTWQTQEWVVKEIYLLFRKGGDPFFVKYVVPLGGDTTAPHFGPGSLGSFPNDESQIGRSIVICKLPEQWDEEKVRQLLNESGFPFKAIEIARNPNLSLRDCGVIEFETWIEADNALKKFQSKIFPQIHLNRLCDMAYLDVIGGSCSFNS